MYQRSVKFPGHTTVLIAASAAGNVLPPLTLFEGSCPAIIHDVSEQYTFAATKSGFINGDLFQGGSRRCLWQVVSTSLSQSCW